jgi:hypothetical protein
MCSPTSHVARGLLESMDSISVKLWVSEWGSAVPQDDSGSDGQRQ